MRELFFECPPLLLTLFKIKAKTFILQLKMHYLLLQRAVLIRRERNALAKNARRAMLVDQLFDSSEQQIHSNPPSVDRHD